MKKEEENATTRPPPPLPLRSPIRTQSSLAVYARYCIHYCQAAVILPNVLITVLEVTTGANCCQQDCTSVRRVLATKGSLFELKRA